MRMIKGDPEGCFVPRGRCRPWGYGATEKGTTVSEIASACGPCSLWEGTTPSIRYFPTDLDFHSIAEITGRQEGAPIVELFDPGLSSESSIHSVYPWASHAASLRSSYFIPKRRPLGVK